MKWSAIVLMAVACGPKDDEESAFDPFVEPDRSNCTRAYELDLDLDGEPERTVHTSIGALELVTDYETEDLVTGTATYGSTEFDANGCATLDVQGTRAGGVDEFSEADSICDVHGFVTSQTLTFFTDQSGSVQPIITYLRTFENTYDAAGDLVHITETNTADGDVLPIRQINTEYYADGQIRDQEVLVDDAFHSSVQLTWAGPQKFSTLVYLEPSANRDERITVDYDEHLRDLRRQITASGFPVYDRQTTWEPDHYARIRQDYDFDGDGDFDLVKDIACEGVPYTTCVREGDGLHESMRYEGTIDGEINFREVNSYTCP